MSAGRQGDGTAQRAHKMWALRGLQPERCPDLTKISYVKDVKAGNNLSSPPQTRTVKRLSER